MNRVFYNDDVMMMHGVNRAIHTQSILSILIRNPQTLIQPHEFPALIQPRDIIQDPRNQILHGALNNIMLQNNKRVRGGVCGG